MTKKEAKDFMWIENNKNPSTIKWQHHKTIRDLHEKLIDKIYDDNEVLLKVKDTYIKELESRVYHAEEYINDLHNS